jgi:ribonuclease R
MAKRRKTPAPFPSQEEIVRFIHESPGNVGKREIARAFHLDSSQKILLKKLLRDLELDGTLLRGRSRRYAEPGVLPNVSVVEVTGIDGDGDLVAKPVQWEFDDPMPLIRMAPERRGQPALGPGDRALARVEQINEKTGDGADIYSGKTIRRLTTSPAKIMGVLEDHGTYFRLRPTDRRSRAELVIDKVDSGDAGKGDLVRAELLPGKRLGLKQGRVVEKLANLDNPRAASLIAIHDHQLPVDFSPEALALAEKSGPAPMTDREDLRETPLITIDGADARDFDDAVFAEPDTDKNNDGGWHLIVAIADVSWYVRPDTALEKAAYERGNSVYFPDRVVPMLPEALSNGWCSLVPHEDRPCLAAHLWITSDGQLKRHKFVRAMMRSHARLTYTQAQLAHDGQTDETTEPLTDPVITNLYGAYAVLEDARRKRGALELDLPERQIIMGDDGSVETISVRERLDSHKLIEEFMITANVAAAEALDKRQQPCMYRIHDQPSMEKMEALRDFLNSVNIKFPKGQVVRASNFNSILAKVVATPQADLINTVILRSQAQAAYHPENIGHFGLNLRHYCHFTSPIRRYSDLLVHRALIRGYKLGEGGLEDDHRDFVEAGAHISATERRAATAERDATDRFTASFMTTRIGEELEGRITGVTRFGLFVELAESGADGLIPISTLPDDYYRHDEKSHCLRGDDTGREYALGQTIQVILREAQPVTGGIILSLSGEDASPGTSRGRKSHKTGSGKPRKSGRVPRGRSKKRKR